MSRAMASQAAVESATVGERLVGESFAAVVDELRPAPDAEEVFRRLAGLPHCLYLDSARRDPRLGRYSFVTADPFDFIEVSATADGELPDAFAILQRRLDTFSAMPLPGLPPFQGGAAGLFSYDLAHQLERLPRSRFDEFQVPAMAIGLYDVVVAFDHAADRAWIISQGFPEVEPGRRLRRANERLEQFRRRIDRGTADRPPCATG